MIEILEISAVKPSGNVPAVHPAFYNQYGRVSFQHKLLWIYTGRANRWMKYHIHITQEERYVKCELLLEEPSFEYGEVGPAQHFGHALAQSSPHLHKILESGFNPGTKTFRMASRLPTYGDLRWFSMQVDSIIIRLDELANPQFERGFLLHDQ